MKKEGFIKIFWGLIFVALDIRIDSIDLLLPDFVGYILIVKGLTLLSTEHPYFQKARVAAVVMIFLSLPSLVEMKVDASQVQIFKKQLVSSLTGDLSGLLPQQISSASLLRTTSSRSEIDANRTRNPQRDEDAVLGEYSDGTVVLILLYPSPEDALAAMKKKAETEYSSEGIQKRAETDESFRAPNISSDGESTSGGTKTSAYSNVEVADRLIQQWWNNGLSWWNPSTWQNKGGWNSRILYIVEGYRSSADAYKRALEGRSHIRRSMTINPLFPISMLGEILNTLLIWGICAGIIALCVPLKDDDLLNTTKRRRAFYIVLTITGWVIAIAWFIWPEQVFSPVASVAVVYVLLEIVAMVLIIALMRRASNSLDAPSIAQ